MQREKVTTHTRRTARVLRRYGAVLTLTAVAGFACGGGDDVDKEVETVPAPPYTSSITFDVGEEARPLLYVEVVDTPEKRALGLMNRESLPEDAGMLFVWTEDSSAGFWMKDTPVPLSIAFIAADGVILDIQDMQPLDETLHHSPAPYRFAVEAKQGWFAERGIAVGDTVRLPEGTG